jgi:hypothetical protein
MLRGLPKNGVKHFLHFKILFGQQGLQLLVAGELDSLLVLLMRYEPNVRLVSEDNQEHLFTGVHVHLVIRRMYREKETCPRLILPSSWRHSNSKIKCVGCVMFLQLSRLLQA